MIDKRVIEQVLSEQYEEAKLDAITSSLSRIFTERKSPLTADK